MWVHTHIPEFHTHMSRVTHKLSATQVKNARYDGRPYKMADGQGLTLVVNEHGRYWWLRYRIAGRERTFSIGPYPDVSLARARELKTEARELIAQGIDPVAQRRAQRSSAAQNADNTFEALAREWWEMIHRPEYSPEHTGRNLRRLELYAFPKLGSRPARDITASEVLEALRVPERQNRLDTAHRVRTLIGQVLRYGIPTGRTDRDVTMDLRGMLRTRKPTHQKAILEIRKLGAMLGAMDDYIGTATVRGALRLAPILFCRPGELRQMRWADLEGAVWHFQPSKNGNPILTELPRQALEILDEMRSLNGRDAFVFPSARGKGRPMSENTINAALRRIDFPEQSGHGFRAVARTILVERLGWSTEIVEMQLGHQVRDMHGRAYNRVQWYDQRRDMLQQWADYLDDLKAGEAPGSPRV